MNRVMTLNVRKLLRTMAGLVLLQLSFAQGPPGRVFTADVSLVTVDTQVTEKHTGRRIQGLTIGDFEILDNGVPQTLKLCEYESASMDVVLLLDVSGSMVGAARDLADAAHHAFEELRDDDRVAVMSFASNSQVHLG